MKTAIVVDDEPIIRMDIIDMLSEMDFSVVAEGADGYDAIEACRMHKPDLLLIDIKMPVFDGLSASSVIIREGLAGCVILLTAYCDDELIERAKEAGVAGYLVKPVNDRMLRPAIEVAMEQSSRYQKAVSSLKKAEDKLTESRMIEKAKVLLARRNNTTESEAYGEMRSLGMKKQCTVGEIARMIISTDMEPEMIQEAKRILMKTYHMSESTAYHKIKELSEQKGVALGAAARRIIKNKGLYGTSDFKGSGL